MLVDRPSAGSPLAVSRLSRRCARKDEVDGDLTILGSGTVVQQLSNLDLVDEYDLVVLPVVLGEGKALFDDVKKRNLKLTESRAFKNGLTLLRYALS